MHFHLPKPLHGWREFAGEVGIIVVGVLIALGAEQLVEDWRWHRQVEQATVAFKTELGVGASDAYERFVIQPCLIGRLKEIAAQLNQPGPKWHGMPAHFNGAQAFYTNALPVVYRPPRRNAPTAAWSNALANGTINHLPADQAMLLSATYSSIDDFKDRQREESLAIAKLTPLATDRMLSADQRLAMLETVGELDRINDMLVTDGRDLLDSLRAAHLGFNDAQVQKEAADVVKLQRDYRGDCVRMMAFHLN